LKYERRYFRERERNDAIPLSVSTTFLTTKHRRILFKKKRKKKKKDDNNNSNNKETALPHIRIIHIIKSSR